MLSNNNLLPLCQTFISLYHLVSLSLANLSVCVCVRPPTIAQSSLIISKLMQSRLFFCSSSFAAVARLRFSLRSLTSVLLARSSDKFRQTNELAVERLLFNLSFKSTHWPVVGGSSRPAVVVVVVAQCFATDKSGLLLPKNMNYHASMQSSSIANS